jgi:GNAT superfamily N-acetyltransferase
VNSAISYRPLAREDLPAAAALVARDLLAEAPADGALEDFLARSLLDSPWADPEIPSLVAVDADGRLLGLVGAEVRRSRLGGREVRLAWAEHLVVDPDARGHAVGVGLLRRLLGGPQDATISDNASDVVERVWVRLGGTKLDLKAIHWVKVFQPWAVGAHLAEPHVRRPRARAALDRVAPLLDRATAAASNGYLHAPPPRTVAEPLTPHALLEHHAQVVDPAGLHAEYDEAALDWLWRELDRVPRRGRLVANLVRAPDERALGWYLYLLRPGWRSEVLQVAARPRHLPAVLDHLFWHAADEGSAALRGRLEPGLLDAVVSRHCVLWHRGGALVHTRDAELALAVQTEGSLLTRLEGDWFADAVV